MEHRAVELGIQAQTSSPNICGDISGDIYVDICGDISDDIFGAMSDDISGNIANDISSDIYDVNIWCMLRTWRPYLHTPAWKTAHLQVATALPSCVWDPSL